MSATEIVELDLCKKQATFTGIVVCYVDDYGRFRRMSGKTFPTTGYPDIESNVRELKKWVVEGNKMQPHFICEVYTVYSPNPNKYSEII